MVSHRHSLPVIHAPQADEQRQEHQGQQLSSCQRRASLRERFWSVSSANAFNEEDHERRVHLRNQQEQQLQQRPRESYTPRHAATDFSLQMSATRGSQHLSSHWEDDDEAGNNDYALFVERSEMMNEAGEAAAARGLLPGRTKSQKRRSLGRRIAEYVKPPREER